MTIYGGLLFCLFDFVLFACFLNRKSLYNSICPLRLSGIRNALPASQALIHVCVHVSLFVCYVDIMLASNMLHKVSLYTKMRAFLNTVCKAAILKLFVSESKDVLRFVSFFKGGVVVFDDVWGFFTKR